jgi:hypothetical protein
VTLIKPAIAIKSLRVIWANGLSTLFDRLVDTISCMFASVLAAATAMHHKPATIAGFVVCVVLIDPDHDGLSWSRSCPLISCRAYCMS